MTGKPLGRTSLVPIADCIFMTSGHYLSHDQVFVPKQTPEKDGDVRTKRNAVEEHRYAAGYI